MDVSVNYWAVLLAAVSSMVVGAIWYSPAVLGKPWMKLVGIDPTKRMKDMSGSQIAIMYGTVFVASLITAYVLAHVAFLSNNFFHNSFLQDALTTALWLWAGFTAARVFVHDVFESRPTKLTALTISHELVTVLVMALVIGAMGFK